LRGGGAGNEEVRAVHPDGVDLAERHEALDVDRPGVVAALQRLELGVLHDDELPLRELPALDELVRGNLLIVRRAPALLLDRREVLAVEQPERDVGLPCSGLRRGRSPTGMFTRPKLN